MSLRENLKHMDVATVRVHARNPHNDPKLRQAAQDELKRRGHSIQESIGSITVDARRRPRFRLYEWIVGRLVVRMAVMAAKDVDLHELRHLDAQLQAGESVDCGPDCPFRERMQKRKES